jgi:hypothetical protein
MSAKFFYFLIVSTVFITSCGSVKKHNVAVTTLHSPESLREDIDYAYNNLQKHHPDLYWNISKDSLDTRFELLKNQIKQPMTSKSFYRLLAPVIASIRQGHTVVYPSGIIQTKKDRKKKGKRQNPFYNLVFTKIDTNFYIKKNYGKDSSLVVNAKLLQIDGVSPNSILKTCQNFITGDGYNTSFVPETISQSIGAFYLVAYPHKDSVALKLAIKDSIYTHYISYYPKKNLKNKNTKKKESRKQRRATRRRRKITGYNPETKENTRELRIYDSIPSTAYMKIRSFTNGNYWTFYEESFKKLDSLNIQNLIIDLRDNGGGRIKEVQELFSYLTDKDFQFLAPSKMTKRMSYLYPSIHNKSWIQRSLAFISFPVLTPYVVLLKEEKVEGEIYLKLMTKNYEVSDSSFKGKIYVLINGKSFSSSGLISTHLKATNRATFVGEETGGAYNGNISGRTAHYELPHSKLRLYVGVLTIKTPHNVEPDGYGVKPDVYIPTTQLDKDEQLDWILSDIKKSK